MERFALVLFTLLLCTTCYAESYVIDDDPPPANNISTHVLDVGNGHPSNNVAVEAFFFNVTLGTFVNIGNTTTDVTGRIDIVHPGVPLRPGTYKLRFYTEQYYAQLILPQTTFFPRPELVFHIDDVTVHYHVPLTLSRYSYTTYKGQ